MIVSIGGTPCTGKTEVAKVLAEKSGWKLVGLNELAEKKDLYSGYDKKRKCKIVDMGGVEEEIKNLSEKHKNLIIESHYAHCLPSDVTVILRCNPKELRKRMRERGWRTEKIEENIIAEIMEVCKGEALEMGKEVVEVDTAGKSVEEVVGEILKNISADGL